MTAFAVQAPGHGGAVITLTAPTTGSVDTVPTGAGAATGCGVDTAKTANKKNATTGMSTAPRMTQGHLRAGLA